MEEIAPERYTASNEAINTGKFGASKLIRRKTVELMFEQAHTSESPPSEITTIIIINNKNRKQKAKYKHKQNRNKNFNKNKKQKQNKKKIQQFQPGEDSLDAIEPGGQPGNATRFQL